MQAKRVASESAALCTAADAAAAAVRAQLSEQRATWVRERKALGTTRIRKPCSYRSRPALRSEQVASLGGILKWSREVL